MKVLQINSTCGVGSTGRIAVDLYRTLTAHGDEGRIAFGRGQAPADVSTIRIGSETGVRVHGVVSRLFDNHGRWSRHATRALLRQVREWQPDIIHLHNIHGYYLHYESLFDFLRETGVPVLWTLHDCWSFTGHCAYFDAVGCDKWKTGCKNCPQKDAYPARLLFDNSPANYRRKKEVFTGLRDLTLVTPSQWLADLAAQSFLHDYPCRVIRNGVDLSVFRPTEGTFRSEYGLEGKKIALGVANIWEPRKGLGDLLEMEKRLGDDWQLVLVGVSEQQRRELPPHVLGIGRTRDVYQLAEIYTAADVFVNATHEDNFPTTNIEALACGTPVVTYQTGGSPESIDGTCGAVVPTGDVEALTAAVTGLHVSTEDCLRRAAQYDKNARYEEYYQLYREIARA